MDERSPRWFRVLAVLWAFAFLSIVRLATVPGQFDRPFMMLVTWAAFYPAGQMVGIKTGLYWLMLPTAVAGESALTLIEPYIPVPVRQAVSVLILGSACAVLLGRRLRSAWPRRRGH